MWAKEKKGIEQKLEHTEAHYHLIWVICAFVHLPCPFDRIVHWDGKNTNEIDGTEPNIYMRRSNHPQMAKLMDENDNDELIINNSDSLG